MSGHDDHGPVEAPIPHVLPMKVYLGVFGVLVFLTVFTVVSAQVDLGPFNLPLAMVIATTKGSLVCAIFMHMWFDNKQYTIVFVTSLLFVSIFIIVTMSDLETRAFIDPVRDNYVQRDQMIEAYKEANPDDPEHLLIRPGMKNAKEDADLKKTLVKPGSHGGEHAKDHPVDKGGPEKAGGKKSEKH